MRVIVKKWGNSAAVRIPSGIMEAAQIALDDALDMREQEGEIVMTPVRTDKVDLENLLQAITADNLHAEVDFGSVVGKESL
jgi:antitoxin MazE